MSKYKIQRLIFYLSALFATITLIVIITSDRPIDEMNGMLWVLASAILTTIAMAFSSARTKKEEGR